MKITLKLEEAALFILAIFGLYYLNAAWWWYLLLALGPDISMLGYLGGNTIGAFSYNLFHHKGLAALLIMAGLWWPNTLVLLIGIVVLGHASMDRLMGYGLKLKEGFKYTHLGMIGRK